MANDLAATVAYHSRPNRMAVSGVTARFGDDVGAAVNIALGGILLRLHRAPKVGAEGRLVLLKGPAIITVQAAVLRRRLIGDPQDERDVWLVALRFLGGSDEIRPLLAHLLHPIPIHELTRSSLPHQVSHLGEGQRPWPLLVG